jgi:hypothetical protein
MRELARRVPALQSVWRVPAWRGLALRWERTEEGTEEEAEMGMV